MLTAFRLLARLRFLRGSWLDPFRHHAERRMERELAAAYLRTIDELIAKLDADNVALATQIAATAEDVRGYGHIKERSVKAAREKQARLLAQFRNPQAKAA